MIDPSDDRPVLVTGASGFVGSHTARLLVARGRRVRVMLRAKSSRAALDGLPVEAAEGDVLDPASLRRAMAGCATVFHCVVDPRFWLTDPTPVFRNIVEGLDNAMDAAQRCGVGRFVLTSTMGTLGLDPDRPVTEAVPFNWSERAPPYIRARLEAERRFLARCRERGLSGIALCIANTYGPEDYQPTPHGRQLHAVASGRQRVVVDVAQPTVDIRDVAAAALLAETRGRSGERYIIANEFVGARAFFGLATAAGGVPSPRFLPYRVAYAIASATGAAAKLLGRRDVMSTGDAVFLANVFRELDSTKARRELGWEPRPLAQTIADAVAWFARQEAGPA